MIRLKAGRTVICCGAEAIAFRAETTDLLRLCGGLAVGGWLALSAAGASGQENRLWTQGLLQKAEVWTDRMNAARVSAGSEGLRVEVAPGKRWAIAAVPGVQLPPNTGRIRVRVRSAQGGARWLMRLYGDVRGTGAPTTASLFESETRIGALTAEPDPRSLIVQSGRTLQVQLGLEGEPGASVLFESVEFLPGRKTPRSPRIAGQRNLPAVDLMPNLPRPLKILDWREKARAYDRFVFDLNAKGEHLPLIWLDDSRINIDRPAFGLSSYVGDKRLGGSKHESITSMGAVLGATLVGINKRRQAHDYVLMCEAYFNSRNGQNLVLNSTDQGTGSSFWYELFPHIVFYALTDRYPNAGRLEAIMRITAERWREACEAMKGADGKPDFDHTSFDFATRKPVDNGQWKEPDSAAGIGWLQYMAWRRFRDPKFLQTADACITFLHERKSNPYYEALLPWGTLTAARMNAEQGRQYDLEKLLNWCFGLSDCRGGWGVITQNWHGYDCAGLLGSVDNRGGYAFAMNTFAQAGALVPVARYDTRFARAIGKWMLNLTNAARLFYPKERPATHQSSAFWKGDPQGVIAYEGLRREWEGKGPYATGDPIALQWGPATDLGLYGSGYVGMLGSIVRTTNVPGILQLDCLATDFFRERAYPTYLYYNPYGDARTVEIEVGNAPRDLYDAVTGRFLARRVKGRGRFTLAGDHAAVIVAVPSGGRMTQDAGGRRIGGIVVQYLPKSR